MESKTVVAMAGTKVLSTADGNMPHNSKFINADIQNSRGTQRHAEARKNNDVATKKVIKLSLKQKLAK